jgi:hypothetical protein
VPNPILADDVLPTSTIWSDSQAEAVLVNLLNYFWVRTGRHKIDCGCGLCQVLDDLASAGVQLKVFLE